MTASGLGRPTFFEALNGTTAAVNKDRFVDMLGKLWLTIAKNPDLDTDAIWFQQDRAPAHASRVVLSWLKDHFGERVINVKTRNPSPVPLSDLTPLDVYLCGLIESRVHPTFPKSLPDLKKAIRWMTRGITFETCAKVIVKVARRTNLGIL